MKELIFTASKKDFRVDTFASGGPGGQHQNKTQSGVRITHLPTGLFSECRETRNQGENKKRAWKKLCDQLIRHVKVSTNRKKEISTETIRTYHEPDNRVKDHASGEIKPYKEVVFGDAYGSLIEARRKAITKARSLIWEKPRPDMPKIVGSNPIEPMPL